MEQAFRCFDSTPHAPSPSAWNVRQGRTSCHPGRHDRPQESSEIPAPLSAEALWMGLEMKLPDSQPLTVQAPARKSDPASRLEAVGTPSGRDTQPESCTREEFRAIGRERRDATAPGFRNMSGTQPAASLLHPHAR